MGRDLSVMVKGPNLKSNELPRLNLPGNLRGQTLTGGATLVTRRGARALTRLYSLTSGSGLSVAQTNKKMRCARCGGGVSNQGARGPLRAC